MTTEVPSDEALTTPAPRRTRRSRKPRGLVITVAVVAAVGAAGTGACLLHDPTGQASPPAATTRLPPTTEKVVRGDLVDEVRAIGPVRFSGNRAIRNQMQGIVTWTPAANATVDRGEKLYAVDDEPVVLLLGNLPAYRAFEPKMSDGKDVRALEENLAALGYSDFTVDEEFSKKTEAAVKRWQKDIGLPATGKIELGRVVFLPAPVRVGTTTARPGDPAERGADILQVSGTTRQVAVEIPLAQQEFAVKGSKVAVVLPDGRDTEAVIASVGENKLNKEGKPVVPVSVRLTDPGSLKGVQNTDVIVVLKRVQAKNVLSVPVTALLPRTGGGYAVQVVDGTEVRTVPVTVGAFADGRAEISGPGLAEGVRVGVPKL